MNLADFTSTSDEVLDDFKTEVQDLINNENRTSAQLEEEIERLSDDGIKFVYLILIYLNFDFF